LYLESSKRINIDVKVAVQDSISYFSLVVLLEYFSPPPLSL